MKRKQIDPKQQFSKWLARIGVFAWIAYIFSILAVIYWRPEAATACIWLTLIITTNKMIDTVAYTKNSTTEKILLSILDKTKMELSLKSDSAAANETEEEGESNG